MKKKQSEMFGKQYKLVFTKKHEAHMKKVGGSAHYYTITDEDLPTVYKKEKKSWGSKLRTVKKTKEKLF